MKPYSGIWPVAPTAFNSKMARSIEEGNRCGFMDCMIDQGVGRGICILANYSEQFLLSDSERRTRCADPRLSLVSCGRAACP